MKMNMKKTTAVAALAGLIALTGCSTSNDVEATAPSVEAAASTPTEPATESTAPTSIETAAAEAADKSPRGNLIKTLGEGAGVTNANGDVIAEFVVNSITPAVCTGPYAVASENGNLIALDVNISTTPELAAEPFPMFDLNPYSMKVIAPNGTTSNVNLASAATYSCLLDGEAVPTGIGPAENVTGKIIIDSEVPSGTLVVGYGMLGWEYEF